MMRRLIRGSESPSDGGRRDRYARRSRGKEAARGGYDADEKTPKTAGRLQRLQCRRQLDEEEEEFRRSHRYYGQNSGEWGKYDRSRSYDNDEYLRETEPVARNSPSRLQRLKCGKRLDSDDEDEDEDQYLDDDSREFRNSTPSNRNRSFEDDEASLRETEPVARRGSSRLQRLNCAKSTLFNVEDEDATRRSPVSTNFFPNGTLSRSSSSNQDTSSSRPSPETLKYWQDENEPGPLPPVLKPESQRSYSPEPLVRQSSLGNESIRSVQSALQKVEKQLNQARQGGKEVNRDKVMDALLSVIDSLDKDQNDESIDIRTITETVDNTTAQEESAASEIDDADTNDYTLQTGESTEESRSRYHDDSYADDYSYDETEYTGTRDGSLESFNVFNPSNYFASRPSKRVSPSPPPPNDRFRSRSPEIASLLRWNESELDEATKAMKEMLLFGPTNPKPITPNSRSQSASSSGALTKLRSKSLRWEDKEQEGEVIAPSSSKRWLPGFKKSRSNEYVPPPTKVVVCKSSDDDDEYPATYYNSSRKADRRGKGSKKKHRESDQQDSSYDDNLFGQWKENFFY